MTAFTEFLSAGRLNILIVILAALALFAAAQRNLFGLVRVFSVVTLLAVIYTVVLNLGSMPASVPAGVTKTSLAMFLALASIFAIWAAQDESKSAAHALERAAWGQIPLAV